MNNGAQPSRKGAARVSNLYQRTKEPERLQKSYKRTQQGARKYRKAAIMFDMSRERKLGDLQEDLDEHTYKPGGYNKIEVHEPKERIVHAPQIRDKIVQFATHEVLQEVYKPIFITDTYACFKNKGTHDAVQKIQHNMRKCVWENGDAWIIKIDIRKYFYTIDREILKNTYRKQIPDYEAEYLDLLDDMVNNSPEPDNRGIPLGNVTSQDFANIIGNEIDQFCKRYLGLKYYVRFMDDIIIVVPTLEEAREKLKQITEFVNERLNLELNEKTKIFPYKQGVKALGYVIKTTHISLQKRTIQGMKRRMKELDRQYKAGEKTEQQVQNAVGSWLGHARFADAYNLCKKIFEPYPYIKFEDPKQKFGRKIYRKKKKGGTGNGKRNNTHIRDAKG
jgi:retron-type reverse transcriptase